MLYQSDQIINLALYQSDRIDSINHRESYTSQITLTLLKEEEQTGILLVKQQTGILLVKSVFHPVSPLELYKSHQTDPVNPSVIPVKPAW